MRFAAMTMMVMLLAGCCTCLERYDPALKQIENNLEMLQPTMEKGAATLPTPALAKTEMGLYLRTKQGVKRLRGEGPEVFLNAAEPVKLEEDQ